MHNKFRRYNKSLLVNVFMGEDYKDIWNSFFIPEYDNINSEHYYCKNILLITCIVNKKGMANLLLQHFDVNINAQDKYGDTVLLLACRRNQIKMAKLFLQHPKIDVNIKNKDKLTALRYAKRNNNKELINLLQSYGAK